MLDLRDIIEIPGTSIPFKCELDTERLDFPSIAGFVSAPTAEGKVTNSAGALTLEGVIEAKMICICDRCGDTFEKTKRMEVSVPLAAELEDEENPDIFLLEGNELDLDDVLSTVFILDMETKFLCSEDCKGLCAGCGANLNKGPCSCKKQVDPRMAVLGQLLDNTED
jgi:uncharacterized protein